MSPDEVNIYRNTLLLNEFGYEYCIETSISWVLLCKEYVFKIKKPVDLGFLDYSTLDKRKKMCDNEFILNSRFSSGVYVGVVEVRRNLEGVYSHEHGELIDYAVKMKKIDHHYLLSNLIEKPDPLFNKTIAELATHVAGLHNRAPVIPKEINVDHQYEKIGLVMQLMDQMTTIGLEEFYGVPFLCVQTAEKYLHKFSDHFSNRNGAIRECHGDMHSENIFILPDGIEIIDCIEFKDDYRYIDVLDDFSATLTDLECYAQQTNVDLYLKEYTENIEVFVDPILIRYYKLQRAVTRFSANVLSGNIRKSRIYVRNMAVYADDLVKLT